MDIQLLAEIAVGALALILFLALWKPLLGIVSIPENCIGVVNIKFVLLGRHKALPDGRIVALQGEAGWQADTLAPGLYFFYWPWQYRVERIAQVIVPPGEVGVVEANDGTPIPAGRVLAKHIASDAFQDARTFLSNGGERGPQITAIPPGTYRINTALFNVQFVKAISIPQGEVGIVTTFEGKPLAKGEIAGAEVAGHTMFQNGQAFLDGGGFKGLQEQVILAGTYFLNPKFASVELVPMTSVPIGHVGVVVAYVGTEPAEKADGANFTQGIIVDKGQKGVWGAPLDPGMYPINPYTHKVELVPTTNIVLNWAKAKSEAHDLDKNLSSITVRSSDGFTFNLDVQQIIHIARQNASKVIARFGNMVNLVTQVLEPLIGNYFRNSAQRSDVIEFLRNRQERQGDAREHIKVALDLYNVQAVDTLIGDITPPAELMKTLTDRKVAEQQQITYGVQKSAQEARIALQEQQALADTKPQVIAAQRSVEIAEKTADAKVKTARGDADSKTINAEADAKVKTTMAEADATVRVTVASADAKAVIMTGEASGKQALAVGMAEADVLKAKVSAVGADSYALMQIANYLATNGIKLVPDIQVSGGADGRGGSIVDAFVAMALSKGIVMPQPPGAGPPRPAAE